MRPQLLPIAVIASLIVFAVAAATLTRAAIDFVPQDARLAPAQPVVD